MPQRCLFCRLADQEGAANRVYEDEHVVAFPALHPLNPGHLVLIPRAHIRNAYALNKDLAGHMIAVGARLAALVAREFGYPGTSLAINNEAPGQRIFHAHLHIIPRRPGDRLDLSSPPEADRNELAEVARRLRQALAAERAG
ncbi:MAG: HIT family protein [Armatimonadetes bacterium]|nr:HIT family protein [Armatimonadota bacterium]